MSLTNNPLPSILPTRALPKDQLATFAEKQIIAVTGYLNNQNLQVPLNPGRYDGFWVIDISNLKMSATDEKYEFALFGSNDPNFGNGNVELLAYHDLTALSANRLFPNILSGQDPVPPPSKASSRFASPFSNQIGEYVLQYVQCYVRVSGTSPTATCSSWISIDC